MTTEIPRVMSALVLEEFGGPEALHLREVPVPSLAANEVLVQVAYCGVCRHDLLTRSGAFPATKLPVIPGHQVSGRIVALGSDVSMIAVGERVMTTIRIGCGQCKACKDGRPTYCENMRAELLGEDMDGGYAEYVKVREDVPVRLPDALPLREASVVSCTLGTAYHAVTTRGGVQRGDTVLITGASGGVGLHAVEIAARLGAVTLAVTSSEPKAEVIRAAGADEVLVAPDRLFAKQVKALTDGRGADVVLDVVGSATLDQSIRAVKKGGTVVLVGNVDGKKATIRPAHFILKEISLVGTRTCSLLELKKVLDMLAEEEVRVHIEESLPLTRGAEAHQLMEDGRTQGRIVLEISPEVM